MRSSHGLGTAGREGANPDIRLQPVESRLSERRPAPAKSTKVWIAVVGLALMAAYSQVRLYQLEPRADESIRSIDTATQEALENLRHIVSSDLSSVARTVSDEQTRALEERLQQLGTEVAKRETELNDAKAQRDRILSGLPEQVELDQLNDYYAAKWKKTDYFGAIESFNTSLGQISFQRSHFAFAHIPSSGLLAWVRIGKNDSSENSELIKAWLSESERAKVQLGYARQYRKTKPSDYGEYTESLYLRGDMYFKTYLQYQRVQGTYGRHSLQYTYYVEVGSSTRKKQYELEQYNQKLGS